MEISEAIERLEYLQAKAQIALEQEMPEWVAEDILGTIEAYDIAIEALRKFENCSEKPNNCEHITKDGVTCAKYPACDDCPDNPLSKVKGSERLVKGMEKPNNSTCSKMEQVDKDINVRSKDEPQRDCLTCKHRHGKWYHTHCDSCSKAHSNYEPQTDLVNDSQVLVKDLVDDEFNPYDEECMRCKHLKLRCEFVPSYCKYELRNEPQTERSSE